tara:strand:+ start:69 stop:431 length:363 start_codon:yes stop_codon:yes gene_type:complete
MVEVRILTQVEENCGHYEGNFKWKKKGGQEFSMNVDDGLMMYGDKDVIIKSFQKFLDLESNDYVKYTYLSHELVFHTSIELKGNLSKVYEKISEEIEKEETNHIIGGVDFSESIKQLNNL